MEIAPLLAILKDLPYTAPWVVFFIVWYFDRKDLLKVIGEIQLHNTRVCATIDSQDDKILASLDAQSERLERIISTALSEQLQMYNNNASLVKRFVELAEDNKALTEGLRDIIVLNTRQMANVENGIRNNLFCPVARDSGGRK